jgi:hypothetical protein
MPERPWFELSFVKIMDCIRLDLLVLHSRVSCKDLKPSLGQGFVVYNSHINTDDITQVSRSTFMKAQAWQLIPQCRANKLNRRLSANCRGLRNRSDPADPTISLGTLGSFQTHHFLMS